MRTVALLCAFFAPETWVSAQAVPSTSASTGSTAQPSALSKINVPGTKTFNPDQPVVLAPKLVKQPDPEFPKQARKDKLSGRVDLTMTVDEAGNPQDVHVDAPVGHGFDEAALKAVRQWRFEPATRDGKPVAVTMRAVVAFQDY